MCYLPTNVTYPFDESQYQNSLCRRLISYSSIGKLLDAVKRYQN